ncbi:MAG: polysaccharide deacetylase family protein [Thermaerobacterales bacterium]
MIIRIDRFVRRRLILAASFLGLLLLVRGGLEIYGLAVPAATEIQPLRNAGSQHQAVSLTFNITWGDQIPEAVLSVLRDHDVQATFFLSGSWAADHPELVAQMREDGHDLGSYGYRHLNLTQFDAEELTAELEQAVTVLTSAADTAPSFFRPPAGAYDDQVIETAAGLGMLTVLWDVDASDWLHPGPAQITAEVLRSARPGSIVLLHAGEANSQTLRALPDIIRGLKDHDFELLPLSVLLTGP